MNFEGKSIWPKRFHRTLDGALEKRSEQPDGVVPPPLPIETEKPGFDWNMPFGKVKKLRGIRDISTLVLAAASDVTPGLGLGLAGINAVTALATGIAGGMDKKRKIDLLKERESFDETDQQILKKLGLTEEEFKAEESIFKLTFQSLFKDSAVGKIFGANKQIDLERGEKLLAGGLGAGLAVGTLLLSEFVREGVRVPVVKTLISRLMTRLVVQQLAPRAFIEVSGLMFKKKDNSVAKAEDFVDLTLSAMSATFVALTTGMMAYKGIFEASTSTATTEPAETATVTVTAAATVAAAGKDFWATPAPIPWRPTETATPPLEAFEDWQAGDPVDQELLNDAANAGHLLDTQPRPMEIFGQNYDLYGFNLDDADPDRDVLAIKNESGDYIPVIWETFGGFYKFDLPGDDIGPLNYQRDAFNQEDGMDIFEVGGTGGAGEFSLNLQGGQDWDLDGDRDDDLIPQADGVWFIDKDDDDVFGVGDIQLKGEPVFNPVDHQAVRLEAVDGQMWWRGADGKMMGLIKDAGSQWFIDREAKILAPDTQDNIRVNGVSMEASLVAIGSDDNPEFRVEFKNAEIVFRDGGKWVFNAAGEPVGTLADGRNLHLDSAGETGIWAIQHALAVTHPDWSPDEVGKAAFLAPADSTRSSILNIHRPEPYQAPSGTLTFDDLVKDSRGGAEGIIQGQLYNNGVTSLTASQAGQAASIAVMNHHPAGQDMIQDVNTSIARFSLENVFGQRMTEKMGEYGLNDKYIFSYASRAAWTDMQDSSVGWNIPNDTIRINQTLGADLIKDWSSQDWDKWLEEWLRTNGYIN